MGEIETLNINHRNIQIVSAISIYIWDYAYTVVIIRVGYFVLLITPTNHGQLSKPGTDLKTAGLDVFKTPPTCAIWPSFGWYIWG